MKPKTIIFGMTMTLVCVGTFAAIEYRSQFDAMHRTLAELDTEIGKKVEVSGLEQATVVTSDRENVWVTGLDGSRRVVILGFERKDVVFANKRSPSPAD